MPDNLMTSPCDPVPAGTTVQSLAEGYIANTKCVRAYQKLLEEQKQYKKKVEEIYVK